MDLLILCQRNINDKKVEKSNQEINIDEHRCNFCDMKFNTGTGLTVHIDLEHPTKPINKAKLKCKPCVITCSDLNVMSKHIICDHKCKSTECLDAFKEESKLETPISHVHREVQTKTTV